ncbi:hypothetical protein [Pseudomonas sp. H9]|uniref:hypothetical protein n=1 Tax=Pseudomonas sp. H9 TaxID=483968 RepID=UPI0010576000|nr:hypothetical protein [Pseudomonas sp. H9]TDF83214.1 hypothetical protein E1573_10985 [Pseudomonas sp. H9]
MKRNCLCNALVLSLLGLLIGQGASAQPPISNSDRVIATAQARIASLDASIHAVELFSGKPQSAAKVAYYKQQIALEEQLIRCEQTPDAVNCAPIAAATRSALEPCLDEHPAK